MDTRYFALITGIVYAAAGILGFVPEALRPATGGPPIAVDSFYGYLLGLFPVNILHNLVHLGIGVWGIAAYGTFVAARTYAASLAVIYAALTVMGLIPGLDTVFGLVPLFGHDVWLHGLTAIIAAYFGFRRRAVEAIDYERRRRAA